MLRYGGRGKFSEKNDELVSCGNSGHMAVNLAALAGGGPLILLGFDARNGEKRRTHFFGDHPDQTNPVYTAMRKGMAELGEELKARDIRVLNATPGSALDCFEKVSLDDALAGL